MILLGNAFPLSLIRRRVVIEPATMDELRHRLHAEGFLSYWGHADTLDTAAALLGVDVTPCALRPVLRLNDEHLPLLNDQVFQEVWVLSPCYTLGFRHEADQAAPPTQIVDWEVLKLSFTP